MMTKNIKVDLILTDPPYNISRKNNFHTIGRSGIHFGEWDVGFDQEKWLNNISKILNKNGSIIIFNDWRNLGLIANKLENEGLIIKDIIRWKKTNPMPRNTSRRYVTDYEFAIWAVMPNSRWVFNKSNKIPYLIPEYESSIPVGKDRIHPTQKSKKIIDNIIKTHSNEGDLIFDPFSGSGQIGFCAYNLKRNFIACEINKKYYELSSNRFNKLFAKPAFNHLGNKYRIINIINSAFSLYKCKTMCDVFGGSGIVSVNSSFHNKIINEKDKYIYELFKWFKNEETEIVIKKIKMIISDFHLPTQHIGNKYTKEFELLKSAYNKNKNIDFLLTLLLFGFNQQLRFNSSNNFNIPAGKFYWSDYQEQKIKKFIELFRKEKINITNLDFEEFVNSQINRKDDKLFYFDPPYFLTDATYNMNWNEQDEIRLIKILEYLIKQNKKWILSNMLLSKGTLNKFLYDFILENRDKIIVLSIPTNYSNSNYQRNNSSGDDLEILICGGVYEK